MPTPAEFAARMREALAQSKKLEGEALQRALALLKDAHKDVLGRITSAGASASSSGGFSRFQLNEVKRELEARLAELERALATNVSGYQAVAFDEGVKRADSMIQLATGTTQSLGAVDRTLLGVAQNYSADLVKGLVDSQRARLTQILQRSVLGGLDMTEIVREIGRTINTGAAKNATARALTIARTEILRMESVAQQSRFEQAREAGAKMQKQWFHVPEPNPRPDHLDVHGQIQDVDQPFVVGGEELMFPRDPAASAANTVNCRCRMLPFVPGLSKEISAAFAEAMAA